MCWRDRRILRVVSDEFSHSCFTTHEISSICSMSFLLCPYGFIITSIIKCVMKLLTHSRTSTVEPLKFKKWISNFITYFTGYMIIYPCWDLSPWMLEKWTLGQLYLTQWSLHTVIPVQESYLCRWTMGFQGWLSRKEIGLKRLQHQSNVAMTSGVRCW